MRLLHTTTVLLGCILACNRFDSMSSGGECVDCPRQQPERFVPGLDIVKPVTRHDTFAPGSSLLFARSSLATNVAVLSASGTPLEKHTAHSKLEPARRELYANSAFDLAVLLEADEQRASVLCGPKVVQTSVRNVDKAANAIAMAPLDEHVLVAAFQRSDDPASASTTLSVFAPDRGCDDAPLDAATLSDGPYEVQASPSAIYLSSQKGLQRLEAERAAPGAGGGGPTHVVEARSLDATQLRGLQVASDATHDYLVGLDGTTVRVLTVPKNGAAPTLRALDAAVAPEPSAGGAGGEAGAGAVEPTPGSGGAAVDAVVAPIAFAITPSGGAVLVQDVQGLRRHALPISAEADATLISTTSQTLVLGSADDCVLGFTRGQETLETLDLTDGASAAVALPRPIESSKLFCRPSAEGPLCCDGVAVVEHRSDSDLPLGRTEAYSLVDLASGRVETFSSSLALRASAAFDDGNTLLLAQGDERSEQYRFEIVTPFLDGPSFVAVSGELPAMPLAAGVLGSAGSLAYIALSRADGGVLFVTRSGDAIAPSSYTTLLVSDFYLQDRVRTMQLPEDGT